MTVPWFERPIFDTVRYMSAASAGKKFNSRRYIENVASETGPVISEPK
jgi:deoxyribodipyrimidine photo-lyase